MVFFDSDKYKGASAHIQDDPTRDGVISKQIRPLIEAFEVKPFSDLEDEQNKALEADNDARITRQKNRAEDREARVEKITEHLKSGEFSLVAELLA